MPRSSVLSLLLLLGLLCTPAHAHKLAPALLELRSLPSGTIVVNWRLPADGSAALALSFSADCRRLGEGPPTRQGTALEWQFHVQCGSQPEVRVEDLSPSQSAVLLRWWPEEGDEQQLLLNSDEPGYVLENKDQKPHGVVQYLQWGISHILIGFDHLLFVLGLFLISEHWRQRLLWVTAFTLGHSLTLIAASTGLVSFDTGLVEVAIAASILVLALGINTRPSDVTRSGFALLVLGFGLLHGLGFASVLGELGLPLGQQLTALLLFNLGVEVGQLLFIAMLALVFGLIARIPVNGGETPLFAARLLSIYTMGGCAMYWMVSRAATSLW